MNDRAARRKSRTSQRRRIPPKGTDLRAAETGLSLAGGPAENQRR